MSSYTISTERLGLREWLEADLQSFSEMNKDVEVMKYFPKTLDENESYEMVQGMKMHFKKNGFGLFAVENKLTGKFIGFTGFAIPSFDSYFTPCIEIGWRYQKEFWNRGLATEAAKACLEYGFDILGFTRVLSFTSAINSNSIKVMKRIGMRKAGEFDHPSIEPMNKLCKHVLYEIRRA